ncbi:MAG: aspartyl protease, partial [Microcoleus sp.]
EGKTPLLGVIPMEVLGIEVDLKNQRLKVLSDGPTETYLTIL